MKIGCAYWQVTRRDGTTGLLEAFLTGIRGISPNEVETLPGFFPLCSSKKQHAILTQMVKRAEVLICRVWLLEQLLDIREDLQKNIGIIVLPFGSLPRGGPHCRKLYGRLTPQDRIIVQCSADKNIFEAWIHSTPATVHVLPMPVDAKTFQPQKPYRRTQYRAQLGLKPDQIGFVYAGRNTPEKNVYTLMRAFAAVLEDVPGAR